MLGRLADVLQRFDEFQNQGLDDEEWVSTCGSCLQFLDQAASTLSVEPASRAYRASFSLNYQRLFPCAASRDYRVEILGGCLGFSSSIYINGERHDMSEVVESSCKVMLAAWLSLGTSFHKWNAGTNAKRKSRSELRNLFQNSDKAWADSEFQHISALILIEDKSRNRIGDAVKQERSLTQAEARSGVTSAEYLEELENGVVHCLFEFNRKYRATWT